MMFGWTSDRFQKLYESGKIDASLSLEIEVTSRFHFVMLTMDTKEPVAYLINLGRPFVILQRIWILQRII